MSVRVDNADQPPPLALAYISAQLLTTHAEREEVKARLASFTNRHGYVLGSILVEQVAGAPAAFNALIAAIQDQEAAAVVVPSMEHFAVLGTPAVMKQHLEHRTSALLLIAESRPSECSPGSTSAQGS